MEGQNQKPVNFQIKRTQAIKCFPFPVLKKNTLQVSK